MIYSYRDKQISYEVHGNGPVVVLLHGFLESSTMWAPLVETLQQKFTLLTVDLPGHGESDVYGEIHSMEFMAKLLKQLLDYLEIDSVSLVGHSMGGYVALEYLDHFRADVRQVILLNSTPYADSEERKANRNRALELVTQNKGLFIKVSITNLFAEDTRERFRKPMNMLIREASNMEEAGILSAIRGMRDRKDHSETLKKFKGDKMMIAGTKDEVVPLDHSRKAAKSTGCRFVEIESGHMTLTENVNDLMKYVHFIE